MKKSNFLVCFLILVLQTGCYGGAAVSTSTMTGIPTQQIGPSSFVTDVPTQPLESTRSTALPTQSQVPAYPPETRMQPQCLDFRSIPIHDIGSSGALLLENRASLDESHYQPGTFQLDMRSGQIIEITKIGENQIDHVVSPNRSLLAYESIIFNSEGNVTKDELVIADANGNRIKTIPWEEEWWQTPVWSDNEHVVINLSLPDEENSDKKPLPILVLNPFTNERRILEPDFSGFPFTSSADLPYWEGRWGAIYDPTLTYVVYPRTIENNHEMYTYAVWDLSKQGIIVTLEDVFAHFSDSKVYPMPKWSPDGSRFVFQAFLPTQDSANSELYEVSRDGQTRQLTQLSPVAYVRESSYSWSPDSQHIAMLLGPPFYVAHEKARAAVLDITTLNIIDYCIDITITGDESPIWSPDGSQFVITDRYKKDHQRVILVDINRNIAVQIAEDMEPVGWMIADP